MQTVLVAYISCYKPNVPLPICDPDCLEEVEMKKIK